MAQRYPRLPAILVLVIAMAVGGLYAMTFARGNGHDAGNSLQALEKLIEAGQVTEDTWAAYGKGLADAGKADQAVAAYRKALDLNSLHHEARFGLGTTLARLGNEQALLEFLRDLSISDAKLAVNMLERNEFAPFLKRPEFATLFREARAMAID